MAALVLMMDISQSRPNLVGCCFNVYVSINPTELPSVISFGQLQYDAIIDGCLDLNMVLSQLLLYLKGCVFGFMV